MTNLPLDIRGLLIKRIEDIENPVWQPFWYRIDFRFTNVKHLALIDADGNCNAPWIAAAAGLAARLGRLELANHLIDSWLDEAQPARAAEARTLLRTERWNARRLVSHRREWPKGVVHLEDVASWMIPVYSRLRNRLLGPEQYRIISSGHLLDQRLQEWVVDSTGYARHVDEPPSFATPHGCDHTIRIEV